MNGGDVMVFKASKWRFEAALIPGLWLGTIIYHCFIRDERDIFSLVIYLALITFGSLLVACIMKFDLSDIVLTENEVKGPARRGWRSKRIIVPLASVDLSKSKKGSIWKSGSIVTSDGHKITISSCLGRKQVDKIFQELEQRLASKSA
jgi:hypothetical protein